MKICLSFPLNFQSFLLHFHLKPDNSKLSVWFSNPNMFSHLNPFPNKPKTFAIPLLFLNRTKTVHWLHSAISCVIEWDKVPMITNIKASAKHKTRFRRRPSKVSMFDDDLCERKGEKMPKCEAYGTWKMLMWFCLLIFHRREKGTWRGHAEQTIEFGFRNRKISKIDLICYANMETCRGNESNKRNFNLFENKQAPKTLIPQIIYR
jgi:hypothetical protein